jgi:UDP-2,3-diacylglucosamine pyrophosphatase LpxH
VNDISPMVHYRTIFLSDIHLGTRGCKAEFLVDFLRCHDAQTFYLVGDIVDGWRLRKSWYWPQAHNDVVQKLLRKARKGTRIVYILGNHDEGLRDYAPIGFGNIELAQEAVHETADGRRLLVVHGDWFDLIVTNARWIALLGDGAYTFALWVNHHFNKVRRLLGYDYWSLSAFLKLKVKNAVMYIGSFAEALAGAARSRQLDGVVCGHIHHAEIRDVGGILYCNDGDWVESCTALVEHFDGRLEIVQWAACRMLPVSSLHEAELVLAGAEAEA